MALPYIDIGYIQPPYLAWDASVHQVKDKIHATDNSFTHKVMPHSIIAKATILLSLRHCNAILWQQLQGQYMILLYVHYLMHLL